MYTIGALRNAEQVHVFYHGWAARFYVGKSVPEGIVSGLKERKAEIVFMDGPEDASAMLWRFQPLFDPSVGVFISRDTDSRLSTREAGAVQAWLKSGKSFHIMRDHPYHGVPILGGMWGFKGHGLHSSLVSVLQAFEPNTQKGTDQYFLARDVYPLVKNDAYVHDSFFRCEWWARFFPGRRTDWAFVGEPFDEYDRPSQEGRAMVESLCMQPLQRLKQLWRSRNGFDC